MCVAATILSSGGRSRADDLEDLPPEAQADQGPPPPGAEPVLEGEDEVFEVEGIPIDVVVTGTRTPEDAQRSTVHVDVVTRREAERRGATNVAEALQGQLGVQVNPSAYGSVGNPSAIQIQGLDRDRVLILEDGERVIGGVGGATDLSQLPLTDVERIEIVTGPTSALYGTQALGGVVNVLTGPPRYAGPSGRFRVEGRNPWGALAQASGFYRDDVHGLWAGVEASAQYNEGLRLRPEVVDLSVPERRQYLTGVRVGATDLADMIDGQLRFRYVRDETTGLTEDVTPLRAYLIELPDTVERFILQSRTTFHFDEGSSLRLSLNRQWSDGVTRKDRVDSPLDESRTRTGVLQSAEAVVTVADGDRTWIAGLRGESERFSQRLDRSEFILGEIRDTGREEVAATTLGQGAVYAQLKWHLLDELTVMGGARAEAHLRYGYVIAPRLAIAAPLADWITIRTSGGRGFRAPAAREFGFFFDHAALGYRVVGNPDLEPETSWGVNGDVTLRPSDRAKLRAGVYANWIDDLINTEFVATNPGGVDDFSYVNVGKARTFGGQVDGSYRVGSWLNAEAGYAYTWTRNDTDERPLVGRPPHTVYASLRATVGDTGVEAYVRYRAVTDAFVDEDLRSPGFSTLDARLAYRPWLPVEIYTGVLNALDARKDPTRLGDQRPLAGRTFTLGVIAELSETTL